MSPRFLAWELCGSYYNLSWEWGWNCSSGRKETQGGGWLNFPIQPVQMTVFLGWVLWGTDWDGDLHMCGVLQSALRSNTWEGRMEAGLQRIVSESCNRGISQSYETLWNWDDPSQIVDLRQVLELFITSPCITLEVAITWGIAAPFTQRRCLGRAVVVSHSQFWKMGEWVTQAWA